MSAHLNIIFMGTPEFAVASLDAIHQSKHQVKLVVTGTDKKRGRGNQTSPTPVKAKALAHGLPVYETDSTKTKELENKIREISPDLIVVVAYKILPDSLLQIPSMGAVNLHASLLPKYRGAAPIHHAVMNGEKTTGNTVFKLDSGIDTGGIILQNKIEIGENETTGSVYTKLMKTGSRLLVDALDLIASKSFKLIPQNDKEATPAPKIFDKDCVIDFSNDYETVHNQIRGLSPFPCAYTNLEGKKFKIFSSALTKTDELFLKPGEIKSTKNGVFVGTGYTGILRLVEVQMEGKKRMKAEDFFRGFSGNQFFE